MGLSDQAEDVESVTVVFIYYIPKGSVTEKRLKPLDVVTRAVYMTKREILKQKREKINRRRYI